MLDDTCIASLSKLRSLQELSLRDARLSASACAQHIPTLNQLRQLELRSSDGQSPYAVLFPLLELRALNAHLSLLSQFGGLRVTCLPWLSLFDLCQS